MADMLMTLVEVFVALAIVAVIVKQFILPLADQLKKKKEEPKEESIKNDGTA